MNLTAIARETPPVATEVGRGPEIDCSRPPTGRRIPERAHSYPAIAVLDAKTRVIERAAGVQWVVQHGRHFCRTTEGLLRYAAAGADRRPELVRLPERFQDHFLTSNRRDLVMHTLSFAMSDTPVEVQFTSAGCLNYPCRTPIHCRRAVSS